MLSPKGIWYTPVSGIWQSVWLETVPETRFLSYEAVADIDTKSLTVKTLTKGTAEGDIILAEVLEGGVGYSPEKPAEKVIASAKAAEDQGSYMSHCRKSRPGRQIPRTFMDCAFL